jgi:predicted nucleotidyltransferase
MEQKDYKYEVIKELIKGPTHTRELAKKINTNHMMISRRVNELLNENIIDYIQEGKNKVYSIKRTPEARNHVHITEFYKLNQTLGKYPELRGIIKAIQDNPKIKLAVLFGSYAKDTVKKDSDIDIFVETEDKKLKHDLELLSSKVSVKIGGYDRGNPLIREMEKDHVILKGVELYHEKNRFFI